MSESLKTTSLQNLSDTRAVCGSRNLIPELPNIAYSCVQHGPVIA